jgi:hypothetical protein
VIVDRDFLVVLLHEFIDQRQGFDRRFAHHRRHLRRPHIVEGLAKLRLVIREIHDARPRQRQARRPKLFSHGTTSVRAVALPVAMLAKQAGVLDPENLEHSDGLIERHRAR